MAVYAGTGVASKPIIRSSSLGNFLRKCRGKGRSREAVARRVRQALHAHNVQFDQSQLKYIEDQGRVPHVAVLYELARIYEVPVGELIDLVAVDVGVPRVGAQSSEPVLAALSEFAEQMREIRDAPGGAEEAARGTFGKYVSRLENLERAEPTNVSVEAVRCIATAFGFQTLSDFFRQLQRSKGLLHNRAADMDRDRRDRDSTGDKHGAGQGVSPDSDWPSLIVQRLEEIRGDLATVGGMPAVVAALRDLVGELRESLSNLKDINDAVHDRIAAFAVADPRIQVETARLLAAQKSHRRRRHREQNAAKSGGRR